MWFLANLPDLLQAASSVIGAASVVAAIVPSPKTVDALAKVRAILDFVAFNFGNAKNVK